MKIKLVGKNLDDIRPLLAKYGFEESSGAPELIVAHGGAIWSIVARLFGLDLNDMFFFPLDYCGIDVVEPSCGRWRLVRYNWTPETERL